jgi:hypothetical protein
MTVFGGTQNLRNSKSAHNMIPNAKVERALSGLRVLTVSFQQSEVNAAFIRRFYEKVSDISFVASN